MPQLITAFCGHWREACNTHFHKWLGCELRVWQTLLSFSSRGGKNRRKDQPLLISFLNPKAISINYSIYLSAGERICHVSINLNTCTAVFHVTCLWLPQGCSPSLKQVACRWWHLYTKGVPQEGPCWGICLLMCICTRMVKQHDPKHIPNNSPRAFPARSETILTSKVHPIKVFKSNLENYYAKWVCWARNLLLHLCYNKATKDYFIWLGKLKNSKNKHLYWANRICLSKPL